MAKPRPEKDPEPAQPGTRRVLPMELHVGDRLADESGEWEVVGRPYTFPVERPPTLASGESINPRPSRYEAGALTSASA